MKKYTRSNLIVTTAGSLMILILSVIYFLNAPKMREGTFESTPLYETDNIDSAGAATNDSKTNDSKNIATSLSSPASMAVLEIGGSKYTGTITNADNVYSFMDNLRRMGKIDFTEKTYAGMGKLITSINGIKSGGERTWIYYVNGEKAKVGISNYNIKPGDVVSWKYEEITY